MCILISMQRYMYVFMCVHIVREIGVDVYVQRAQHTMRSTASTRKYTFTHGGHIASSYTNPPVWCVARFRCFFWSAVRCRCSPAVVVVCIVCCCCFLDANVRWPLRSVVRCLSGMLDQDSFQRKLVRFVDDLAETRLRFCWPWQVDGCGLALIVSEVSRQKWKMLPNFCLELVLFLAGLRQEVQNCALFWLWRLVDWGIGDCRHSASVFPEPFAVNETIVYLIEAERLDERQRKNSTDSCAHDASEVTTVCSLLVVMFVCVAQWREGSGCSRRCRFYFGSRVSIKSRVSCRALYHVFLEAVLGLVLRLRDSCSWSRTLASIIRGLADFVLVRLL